MKKDTRVKFETEIEPTETVRARKPVQISRDNRRRYVRLEIISPMWLRRIKDIFGNFTPSEQDDELTAEILNISAGGVLVEVDRPLNEGDIVAMRFRVQGLENLDNVLGLVKRADQDGETYLSGVEFISRERLRDRLSEAELELLGERAGDFNESVRKVLSRYLYTENRTNLA